MNILAFLTLLRDFYYITKDIVVRVARASKKALFRKAIKEAKEGDQRSVEEAISGSSGRPTQHKYDGLHKRKTKKRNRNLAD